jgi:hypothetical protein
MNRSKLSTKIQMFAGSLVTLAAVAGGAVPANALIETPLPQFLPTPAPAAPPSPAPLAPPINPGYAAAPADGLSPILSQSVPLYELPQPSPPSYPAPQLPGPIDQQKLQAYRNSLVSQQWQLQSQGLSPSTTISREILQQLNAPDAE